MVIAANVGQPSILRASRFYGFGRAVRRLLHDVSDVSAAFRNGHPSNEDYKRMHDSRLPRAYEAFLKREEGMDAEGSTSAPDEAECGVPIDRG